MPNHHVLITGPPGSGKTTVAGEIIRDRAHPESILWAHFPRRTDATDTSRADFVSCTTQTVWHLVDSAVRILALRRQNRDMTVPTLWLVLDEPQHAWLDAEFSENMMSLLHLGLGHHIRVVLCENEAKQIPSDIRPLFGERIMLGGGTKGVKVL